MMQLTKKTLSPTTIFFLFKTNFFLKSNTFGLKLNTSFWFHDLAFSVACQSIQEICSNLKFPPIGQLNQNLLFFP